MRKLKFDVKIQPIVWIVGILLFIGLSCTNDSGPTGPNIIPDPDPIGYSEVDIFGVSSSNYLLDDSTVVVLGTYINLRNESVKLPQVGVVIYSDDYDLLLFQTGSFYDNSTGDKVDVVSNPAILKAYLEINHSKVVEDADGKEVFYFLFFWKNLSSAEVRGILVDYLDYFKSLNKKAGFSESVLLKGFINE